MYIPEIKTFKNGTIINAISTDINSLSGFPYVAVYYVSLYSQYTIVTFDIDLNNERISITKYNVRIFYI